MEDYGKFLEEAQQAVLLEEKLRGQETDLKAQTEERQKELAAEEQSLKDSIDRTGRSSPQISTMRLRRSGRP